MEFINPSLNLGNRQDDYKIGVNFQTNQPVYSLDDHFRNQFIQQKILYLDNRVSPDYSLFYLGILYNKLLNNRFNQIQTELNLIS